MAKIKEIKDAEIEGREGEWINGTLTINIDTIETAYGDGKTEGECSIITFVSGSEIECLLTINELDILLDVK